jgi:hypothetical protein
MDDETIDDQLDIMSSFDFFPSSTYDVPAFCKHDIILINGLQASPLYNGRVGKLGNYNRETGRWDVFFLPPFHDEAGLRVKPSNLIWIADRMRCKQDSAACQPDYIFSYMLQYLDVYADIPQFDIASIVRSTATAQSIRFEDRTAALEQIQTENRFSSWNASRIFMQAMQDAMNEKGRLMILFRRTLLSNAAFMFQKAQHHEMCIDGNSMNRHPWDFKLFIDDDYIKSEKGSSLTEQAFRSTLQGLIGLKDTTCSICIEPINGVSAFPDNVTIDCGHMFHIDCFSQWIENSTTLHCPNCRSPYSRS